MSTFLVGIKQFQHVKLGVVLPQNFKKVIKIQSVFILVEINLFFIIKYA